MKPINHLNYFMGTAMKFYCERRARVVILDAEEDFLYDNCGGCSMFAGSLQGEGVECTYPDISDGGLDPIIVRDPEKFMARRQRIAKGKALTVNK